MMHCFEIKIINLKPEGYTDLFFGFLHMIGWMGRMNSKI